jgi:uncharacterized protein YndB with AHSA1/START domain
MNTQLFKHTIWIDRSREAVFDFFVDFTQASRWRQYVRSMTPVSPGPIVPGSRINVLMDLNGEEYRFDLEVLTFERPHLWRHRTNEQLDLRGYIQYTFEPEQQGTRVTMTCVVQPVGFYGWLGLPLMWLNRGKGYREQLPQLKRVMESSP